MQRRWLGLTSYGVGLELQDQAARWAREYGESSILGLEHEAVITLGKRGDRNKDLGQVQLPVVQIDRGGQATLHSPGQLVIYPILPLKKLDLSVKDYVEHLHATTAELLSNYGIETERGLDSGLFTAKGKIAFFGVRVDHGVTRHGLSLNVRNDVGLFDSIRSCGVSKAQLDTMKNYDKAFPLETLFQEWSEIFLRKINLESYHFSVHGSLQSFDQ